jgi:hypothetical protein
MRAFLLLAMICSLAWTATAFTADPVPSKPKSQIRWPSGPVTPVVPPNPPQPPAPDAVAKLAADQVYVIENDTELVILARPEGLVKITEATGPLTIRDKFSDGDGKQVREYKGKYLYIVDPVAAGRVEIIAVPVGGTKADVDTRKIDVMGSVPTPPTPPGPADPLVKSVQEAFKADEGTKADAAALAAVYLACADAVNLDAVKTGKDFYDLLHNSASSRIDQRLGWVRMALGKELNTAVVVKGGETLTKQHKADAAKQLQRFAAILDSLGK